MQILKISFFILFLSIFNFAFALEAPQNIVLDKATNNFLEISWDKVDEAGVYAISYWTKSASGGTYEHDLEIVTDKTNWKIEDLKPDTSYYVVLKAYDTNDNESEYSKESVFKTLKEIKNLKIEDVKVIDSRNLDLDFNVLLNKDSNLNLNIVNKDDNLEEINVENYSITGSLVKVFLDKDLKNNNKYSITVITLEWENGETIKAWVDGIFDFIVPEDTKKYVEESVEDLNSASPEITNSWTTNNSAEEKTQEEKSEKILWWKDLEKTDNITEKVAKTKKDLPTTGPAETFLFLLFSLISAWLFLTLRRKTRA